MPTDRGVPVSQRAARAILAANVAGGTGTFRPGGAEGVEPVIWATASLTQLPPPPRTVWPGEHSLRVHSVSFCVAGDALKPATIAYLFFLMYFLFLQAKCAFCNLVLHDAVNSIRTAGLREILLRPSELG